MKKILKNTSYSAYKWIVFGTFFWLTVFSVAYTASIIDSTTDPTVTSWDSITANWYQDVNNKLGGISVSGGNVGIGSHSIDALEARTTLGYQSLRNQWFNVTAWALHSYQGQNYYQDTLGYIRTIKEGWVTYILHNNGEMQFHSATGLTADSLISNSEKMRIDSAGNVWIWTTSPWDMLEVQNRTNWTDSSISIYKATWSDTDKASIKIGYDATANLEIYRNRANADINYVSNQSWADQIFTTIWTGNFVYNNGNVWIGISIPWAKLDVNWWIKINNWDIIKWMKVFTWTVWSVANTTNRIHLPLWWWNWNTVILSAYYYQSDVRENYWFNSTNHNFLPVRLWETDWDLLIYADLNNINKKYKIVVLHY